MIFFNCGAYSVSYEDSSTILYYENVDKLGIVNIYLEKY